MGKPLVSVLINNYNYGRFLGPAIDSALTQTYQNIEVIVVDDGSTDNSREVIASYGNRIHPVLKENGGQASAYNAGFAASRGDILCLLDSDDMYKPEKIQSVVDVLEEHPDLGWCFDQVREFDDQTGNLRAPSVHGQQGRWDAREVTAAGKPPLVSTASSGLSFRRSTLEHIFPMPELLRMGSGCSSDAYIKWTALVSSPGWNADEELTLMRVHGNNAYTARTEGKQRLRGEIELATGIILYEHWPVLRRLAIKVSSRGLGMLWAKGGVGKTYKQQLRSFVRTLTLPQRSEMFARATIWTTLRRLGR